jgi:hypothetical protein
VVAVERWLRVQLPSKKTRANNRRLLRMLFLAKKLGVRSLQQGDKTGLFKIAIGSQRLDEPMLFHDDERNTIR